MTLDARCTLVLAACLLLVGCDSGGSSTDPPDDGDGQVTLTDARRIATLKAVTDKIPALVAEDPDARRTELLTYLKSRPEFEAAGISDDGSLWARFTDKRLLLIIANRDEPTAAEARPSGASGADAHEAAAGRPAQPARAPGPPAELPASTQARILGGGESLSGTFFRVFIPRLKALISAGGYQLAPGAGVGTIDDLKRVAGDGIFYFGGHGAEGWISDSERIFAVTTATLVSEANDLAYRADWNDTTLAYSIPITSRLRPYLGTLPGSVGYYAFTAKFVTKHMKFEPNSVVYLAACTSAQSAFRQAFLDKGAGVYFGWTNTFLGDVDGEASLYLFDRLLGLNDDYPVQETPPQRPFDYASVHRNLDDIGLTTSASATLIYRRQNSEAGLLAPSIQHMYVNEDSSKLILSGKFGSERGEVTMNGSSTGAIRITSWEKEEIRAEIPVSGPYSAGNVVVWSKGRRSNTRILSEWRPTFNLEFIEGHGTLKWAGEIRLHIRADLNSFREEAGASPSYRTVPFTIARDSEGELEASGTHAVPGGGTHTWSGTARITTRIASPVSPNVVDGGGEIDTESPAMRLFLFVTAPDGMIVTSSFAGSVPLPAVWAYGDGQLSSTRPLPALYLQVNRNFEIIGDYRRQVPFGPSAVLSWSNLGPKYAPSDTVARL